MFRIIYVSTPIAPYSEKDLRDLLSVARSKNEANRVTGMLIYSGGQFLQALEGEPADVIGTFDRISLDPRHADIATLQRGIFADQWFAHWSMGFHSERRAEGSVSVSDRIKLRALDEMSALDLLKSCSRSQTL